MTVRITRETPGMLIFCVDRSFSMSETVAGDGRSLAQAVADTVNDSLHDLCLRCITDGAEGPRPYFRVAVIGYGQSSVANAQAVESGFEGTLAGRDVVDTAELAVNPLRIAERTGGARFDGATIRVPEWITAQTGFATPMCEALFSAGLAAKQFCDEFPSSAPPVVINVTDGMPTDSPFAPPNGQPAPVEEWARRLTTLGTDRGPLVLFNAFVTAKPTDPAWLPASDEGLPEEGQLLFGMSSELPNEMANVARAKGQDVAPGARALIVNASSADLSSFFDIGTKAMGPTGQDPLP